MGNVVIGSVYEKGTSLEEAVKSALQDTSDCPELSKGFNARVETMLDLAQPARFGRAFKIAASIAACVALAGLVFAAAVVMSEELKVCNAVVVNAEDGPSQVEDVIGKDAYRQILDEDEVSLSTSASTSSSNMDGKENQNVNMRKKMTAVFAASALAAASPNLASAGNGEAYTSASYVQDGLIAQWDGIDNAGTGTHDSNALVWKDLKGSCDMTLLSKGSWVNGNALAVTGFGASGNSTAPAYKTIEVVYKMTSSAGRILFTSGRAAVNGKLSQMVGFSVISGNNLAGFFDGTGVAATRYVRVNFDASAVRSMSAIHEDGAVSETYGNGVVDMYQKLDTNWGVSDGKVAVGARNSSDAYTWTGEVFAIRLYSTALTKEQIAANLAVDAVRFGVYEYKYLVSGDPIASAVARSCTAVELAPSTAVEARYRTRDWSGGIALNAAELQIGTMLIIR